jgi:dienelactone hydrolase
MIALTLRSTMLASFAQMMFVLACGAAETSGPWKIDELKQTPEATWGETKEDAQEIFYAGEPFEGMPTRIFAYYARPKEGDGPFPAVLLVHGGGGKAFSQWARMWADRGYVALAMDLAGHGPDGERLSDGGPDQDDRNKFRDFTNDEVDQMWTYHAVSAVIRGCSLLASREEVAADRIGITGISWGGYLACIVAGLDDRLKVAVTVYGCGYLADDSVWLPTFEKMNPEQRKRWVKNFDPSSYLPQARCPILFVNGTNDYSYPLDSWQRSYQLVPGRVDLCLKVRMPHSHPDAWTSPEIGIYVDGVLNNGRPLPTIEPAEVRKDRAVARFKATVPIEHAEAHFAVASGPWNKRRWQSASAVHTSNTVSVELPTVRPLVYYLSVTDERGAQVSTPHAVIEE